MTLFISQHGNLAGLSKTGVVSSPIAPLGLTSAAVSTIAAGAEYVRVSADAGSYLGFAPTALYGSSTTAISSTNAMRIPANTVSLFAIPQGATKIIVAST